MAAFTREDLEQYICEVMEIETITPMIAKQINRLVLDKGMTWKEIARCICWYTEVNGKQLSIIYGISIVENFRIEAAKYFKQLELDQQEQKRQAKKVVEYQDNNIIFNIKNLNLQNHKRHIKQLDLNNINIQGDDDGNY